MKKFAILAASAALLLSGALLSSCDRSVLPDDGFPGCDLTIEVGFPKAANTRAAGDAVADTEGERKINSVDVYVFNSDGSLADHKRQTSLNNTTGSQSVTGLSVNTLGTKYVYAFINFASSPVNTSTGTKTQADAVAPTFISNGASLDSFLMSGSSSVSVTGAEATASVNVSRYVTKVQVSGAPSFSGIATGGTLNAIYLINIPKTFSTSATVTSASNGWNFDTYVRDNSGVESSVSAFTAPSVASLATTPVAMYGMPNATAQAGNINTKDYVTKCVLKCTIGGNVYWYPIGIPAMERNKVYLISGIAISGFGEDDPNKYVNPSTEAAITANITVLDWVEGAMIGSYNGAMGL